MQIIPNVCSVCVLALGPSQCVATAVGGINYLNLSDLPSFLAPLSRSFNHFLFLYPPASTHLCVSTSSPPHWSPPCPPIDMWLLFQDVKPLLPIPPSIPLPSV